MSADDEIHRMRQAQALKRGPGPIPAPLDREQFRQAVERYGDACYAIGHTMGMEDFSGNEQDERELHAARQALLDQYDRAAAEIERLREEAEVSRLRLVACGVAARGASVDDCLPEYRSDSLEAVLELAASNAALRQDRERADLLLQNSCWHAVAKGASWNDRQWVENVPRIRRVCDYATLVREAIEAAHMYIADFPVEAARQAGRTEGAER